MSIGGDGKHVFGRNSSWLDLLLDVLRGDKAAGEIVALDGSEYTDSRPRRTVNAAKINLVKQAVLASPWIAGDGKHDVLSRALAAEPDAVFAILLPLLPELRSLGVQVDSARVQEIVSRIAQAYGTASNSEPSDRSLPLGKLVLTHTCGYNGGHGGGIGLTGIVPFLALPSMRRVIPRSGRDETFVQWPLELPRPRVPEVYFGESSVIKAAVASFIKAWDVPCVVRQSWSSGSGNWDVYLDWDYAVVEDEVSTVTGVIKDGTRHEVVELRYENTDDMALLTWEDAGTNDTFSEDLNALYDGRVYDWSDLV